MTMINRTRNKRPTTLMRIFNFNLHDLIANRKGTLSKRQLQIASATQPNPLVQLILLGHVGIILGVMALIVLASGVTTQKLLFLGVASMVILSPFLYAMSRVSSNQQNGLSPEDIAGGEVLSVCGIVTHQPAQSINQANAITVADMRFTVPKSALELLQAETTYCIYYAPHSQKIVSIEEQK